MCLGCDILGYTHCLNYIYILAGIEIKLGRGLWYFRYIHYTIHMSRDTKLTYINNHDTFKSFTDVFLQPLYAGDYERGQKVRNFICWFVADILLVEAGK